MATILERNNSERDSCFVGRIEEITFFKEMIAVTPPEKNVLSFIGVGGIGKSTLLRQCQNICRAMKVPCSLVEISSIRSPLDLMKDIVEKFVDADFKEFKKTLSGYYDIETKLQGAISRTRDSATAFVENTSLVGLPVGAAVVNLVGKDRLKAFVDKFISRQDLDHYDNAISSLQKAFTKGLNESNKKGNSVLCFDTFEEASIDVKEWLIELMKNGLSENFLIVIAGRDSLYNSNKFWEENHNLSMEFQLQPFKLEECRALLAKRNIRDLEVVDWVYDASGKLPWAIELTIEAFSPADLQNLAAKREVSKEQIRPRVVQRFLRQINADQRRSLLVRVCSVFDVFTEDTIRFVLGKLGTELSNVGELKMYSFFRDHGNGTYSLHDIVKEFINADLKTNQFETWRQIHLACALYFRVNASTHGLTENTFLKFKLDEFSHAVLVDQEASMNLLLEVSRRITGPMMFSEFYVPVIAIVEQISLDKKHVCIISFFEAQLATLNRNDELAIELYRKIEDDPHAGVGLICIVKAKLSDTLYRLGRMDFAFEAAFSGLTLAEKEKKYDFASLFAVKLAEIYGSKGSLKNSEHYCKISSGYLEHVDDPLTNGEVQLLLAYIYLFRNDYVNGDIVLNTAMEKWRSIQYSYGIAQVRSAICWMSAIKGTWEEGKKMGHKSYGYFLDLNDEYNTGLAALNIAQIYYLQNDGTKALYWNDLAHEKFKDISMLYDAISALQSGMCHIMLNDFQAAISILQYGIELEIVVQEQYTHGLLLYYLSIAHHESPELQKKYREEAILLLKGAQNQYGYLRIQLQDLNEMLRKEDKQGFDDGITQIKDLIISSHHKDLHADFFYLKFLREELSTNKTMPFSDTAFRFLLRCFEIALEFNPLLLYKKADEFALYLKSTTLEKRDRIIRDLKVIWASTDRRENHLSFADQELQKRILEVNPIDPQMANFIQRVVLS